LQNCDLTQQGSRVAVRACVVAVAMAGVANTPQDSMHLRIKRRGFTVFLLCYPEQNVVEVRQKIAMMFERPIETFRLMYKGMVLSDDATIRAQQISSNDIIHLVYKADNSDQYEKEEYEDLDRLAAEWDAKMKSATSTLAAPPIAWPAVGALARH